MVFLVELGLGVDLLGVSLDLLEHPHRDLRPFLDRPLLFAIAPCYRMSVVEVGLDQLGIHIVVVGNLHVDGKEGDAVALPLVVAHAIQQLVRVEPPTIDFQQVVLVLADLRVLYDYGGVVPAGELNGLGDQARTLGALGNVGSDV